MNQSRVIALGFFDGVHLGHGQLLRACREEADRRGLEAACLTFDLHPDALVSGKNVELLTDPEERARLLREQYGMDRVITLHFDRDMMNMPWQDFVCRVLAEEYGAAALVCGHDFRFGRRGEGNAQLLQEECSRLGLGCQVIPAYYMDGILVSSTYIRELIRAGELDRAGAFLGHPYSITGPVVSGAHLGRTMGTPTANLEPPESVLLPPKGVYACRAHTPFGTYLAVANVGTRPTVEGSGITVEPWLLDFSGNLYGSRIRLEFWHFLRGERKFPSLEALQAEIRKNGDQTKEYFAGL